MPPAARAYAWCYLSMTIFFGTRSSRSSASRAERHAHRAVSHTRHEASSYDRSLGCVVRLSVGVVANPLFLSPTCAPASDPCEPAIEEKP
eukprot:scaffold9589_cov126-Isochrysis_galbana.AAC.1